MTRGEAWEFLVDRIDTFCAEHGISEDETGELLQDVYKAADAIGAPQVQAVGRVLSFREKFEQRERLKRFES